MKKLFLPILVLMWISLVAQQNHAAKKDKEYVFKDDVRGKNAFRIMFYNTENTFDTIKDSVKNDIDFTSEGNYHWTKWKFYNKLNHIAKTIIALGGWEVPDIIMLAEIENRYVLNRLIYSTPLKAFRFGIVHEESPDARGIDVALIYRKEKFRELYHRAINITFPDQPESKTRDILYVKGILSSKDTLNIFVNHWPSRLGGYEASMPRRKYVASVLKAATDTIFSANPDANILIAGDFNDEPFDESLSQVLKALPDTVTHSMPALVNMMYNKTGMEGSNKYQGNWSIIDQIILSAPLFVRKSGLQITSAGAQIFKADFLLEDDATSTGKKPFRTYSGMKYIGGFSDHLPVYIDLIHNQ